MKHEGIDEFNANDSSQRPLSILFSTAPKLSAWHIKGLNKYVLDKWIHFPQISHLFGWSVSKLVFMGKPSYLQKKYVLEDFSIGKILCTLRCSQGEESQEERGS